VRSPGGARATCCASQTTITFGKRGCTPCDITFTFQTEQTAFLDTHASSVVDTGIMASFQGKVEVDRRGSRENKMATRRGLAVRKPGAEQENYTGGKASSVGDGRTRVDVRNSMMHKAT